LFHLAAGHFITHKIIWKERCLRRKQLHLRGKEKWQLPKVM